MHPARRMKGSTTPSRLPHFVVGTALMALCAEWKNAERGASNPPEPPKPRRLLPNGPPPQRQGHKHSYHLAVRPERGIGPPTASGRPHGILRGYAEHARRDLRSDSACALTPGALRRTNLHDIFLFMNLSKPCRTERTGRHRSHVYTRVKTLRGVERQQ